MAAKRKQSHNKKKRTLATRTSSRYRYEIGGLLVITLGALMLAGMQYRQAGPVVSWLVNGMLVAFGQLTLLIPFLLFLYGGLMIFRQSRERLPAIGGGGALFMLALLGFFHLVVPPGQEFLWPQAHGGYLGAALVYVLRWGLGQVGSYIVLGALAIAALVILSETSVAELTTAVIEELRDLAKGLGNLWQRTHHWWRQRRGAQTAAKPKKAPQRRTPAPPTSVEPPTQPSPEPETAVATAEETTPPTEAGPEKPAEKRPPGQYRFPDLELIRPHERQQIPDRNGEIAATAVKLEETLASFGIEARVVNIEHGPAVTRYEIVLAPGIRVSKVTNLADDLALALSSLSVRVEAPVPGKGVVGIEVANRQREFVYLVDILESPEFQRAKGELVFALGKDIAGHIVLADLGRMPHLLLGGATNSGKSVCLNALIVSLIYRLTPREVRFLMIDPKRVELTLYNGIPHLDRRVVTNPKDAADLLRGAIQEMEARYDRFAQAGVRDIHSFNRRAREEERMPYFIIIIDELADLMMQAAVEFETSICRLAQLARATGIHLVVATQRPSVNVITGTIKANISSRIAFAVASQVDSRTIIDQVGAERLIGSGDMLYYPIEATKPVRIQGAFIGEEQVRRLVNYLRQLKREIWLEYEPIVQPVEAGEERPTRWAPLEEEIEDELYEAAVALVIAEGQASASRLQRKFSIGYNRAGRLIDLMEERGIVGPAEGSKPRKVLVPRPPAP
ncbi:MAG TPA: DNA translocase FtsK, partial [Armatimonadetes bacterium]|nr:DNA translocase FtsK [Armatimonadota bacterium]